MDLKKILIILSLLVISAGLCQEDLLGRISLPLVLITGLIDGINPCAFAVLIFLISYLLGISNDKKLMLKAGLAYIGSIYISYFLIGIGILSIIQLPFISSTFYLIAGIVALTAGAINVKEFFNYGKGITLSIPKRAKGIISKWGKKANVLGAIILGFLVSLFEFPCTGSVYIVILALLSKQATQLIAINYLLIYNLMFVLPLLIILFGILFGFKLERVRAWKDKRKNYMKLATGVLLLILGGYMIYYYFM